MSFPVYVTLGPFVLHPHWVFEGLAYLVGLFWVGVGRRFGDVLDRRARWTIVVAALAGGLVGSRILAWVENPFALADASARVHDVVAAKTIVGGIAGGLIAVEWIKRIRGIRVATGDLLTLPLIAGIAIGRVGCFLSGLEDQSYGVATSLPWGVDFGDGISRHPTQLYEVVVLCGVGALLARRGDRLTTTGDRFKLFVVWYMAFRFVVDFIKAGVHVGGLTMIQWVCLGVLAFYAPHLGRMFSALEQVAPEKVTEREPT
jgi:phosphatidylglycerol:prolipoprotein diacylglycerol transferase